jgi:hypothetical protein
MFGRKIQTPEEREREERFSILNFKKVQTLFDFPIKKIRSDLGVL